MSDIYAAQKVPSGFWAVCLNGAPVEYFITEREADRRCHEMSNVTMFAEMDLFRRQRIAA